MTAGEEIIIRVEGRAGRITLNRPKSLNALTYAQVLAMTAALSDWSRDDGVRLVVLDGAGHRGLCAGGDVRALYDARDSDPDLANRFWHDEYRLNAMIARYPKPFVALMDGIVMGGGIGLSAHASHRVVTERSALAMPETTIGLIPDVGGTWLLAQAPGRLGEYLGLTGERMGAADALYAGFADTHVDSARLADLVAELAAPDGDMASAVIAGFASAPAPAVHSARQTDIDGIFAADTPVAILERLSKSSAPWAGETASALASRSPLSLTLTLEAIRRARTLPRLEDALAMEFRLTNRLFRHGEFLEGVRALLVDKDRSPRWRPDTLAAVGPDVVAPFFAPLEGAEWTPPAHPA